MSEDMIMTDMNLNNTDSIVIGEPYLVEENDRCKLCADIIHFILFGRIGRL